MEQSVAPLLTTINKFTQDLDFLAAQVAESFPAPDTATLPSHYHLEQGQQISNNRRNGSKKAKKRIDPTAVLARLDALETAVRRLKTDTTFVMHAKNAFAQETLDAVAINSELLARVRAAADLADEEDDETAGSVELFQALAGGFASVPGR